MGRNATRNDRAGHSRSLMINRPSPARERFLANLYRMKRDCISFIEEARLRGDSREADEFKEHLDRVESMIEQSGGDPEA